VVAYPAEDRLTAEQRDQIYKAVNDMRDHFWKEVHGVIW
jgi:hypothetical protein